MVAWLVFGGIFLLVMFCIRMWSRPPNRKTRKYRRGGGSGGFTGQAWTAGESGDSDSGGGASCGGGGGSSCGGGGGSSCGGGGGGGGF